MHNLNLFGLFLATLIAPESRKSTKNFDASWRKLARKSQRRLWHFSARVSLRRPRSSLKRN